MTEHLEEMHRQRQEEQKEINALAKRIQIMEKCRQYSGYNKFGFELKLLFS